MRCTIRCRGCCFLLYCLEHLSEIKAEFVCGLNIEFAVKSAECPNRRFKVQRHSSVEVLLYCFALLYSVFVQALILYSVPASAVLPLLTVKERNFVLCDDTQIRRTGQWNNSSCIVALILCNTHQHSLGGFSSAILNRCAEVLMHRSEEQEEVSSKSGVVVYGSIQSVKQCIFQVSLVLKWKFKYLWANLVK